MPSFVWIFVELVPEKAELMTTAILCTKCPMISLLIRFTQIREPHLVRWPDLEAAK